MSSQATSGIRTAADGQAFIPASRRADGSTRKEIKVRPGYQPPEDVERYQSKTAEAWRSKGGGGVPGVESESATQQEEVKNKNARRREAARKKKELEQTSPEDTDEAMAKLQLTEDKQAHLDSKEEEDSERQKKIRNALKRLRAVRELKAKKLAGHKISADQLIKISKESEIVKDLVKLDYHGPEMNSA